MFFIDPVRVFIAVPGRSNLSSYKLYRYDPNPEVGWTKAEIGDGWLEYREDHDDYVPPTVEILLNHFSGLLLEDEEAEASSSGGGGGGGACFIATAAYGSYQEKHVLTFRQFRDNYLLTNAPGRLFVRTYYRYSPPMADFISRHDHLRALVRCCLSPMAWACKIAMASPQNTKRIAVCALLLAAAILLKGANRPRHGGV